MKISDEINCIGFPCADVDKNSYIVPPAEIDAGKDKNNNDNGSPTPG